MKMQSFVALLSLLLQFSSLNNALTERPSEVFHIDWKPQKIPSEVGFTYTGSSFDGPQVRPVNTTTFEWWYFDAVSEDIANNDKSSIVIVFYDATPGGFAGLSNKTTKLTVGITGTFSDGTPFGFEQFPAEAIVETKGDGSSGRWGESAAWTGSPDLKNWSIVFEDEEKGVKGSMHLDSLAPPHLPCGPPTDGASESVQPNIGWAVAVPDAKATVNFEIASKKLEFTGPGYHDKNWGSTPFFSNIGGTYWGHAHVGPYSVVWAQDLGLQGEVYPSAYVAKHGRVLSSTCVKDAVKVRPWGGEDAFPPPQNRKAPRGFEAVFADVEGKQMTVNVTVSEIVIPWGKVYDRFIGTAEGTLDGETATLKGVALFEEFKV